MLSMHDAYAAADYDRFVNDGSVDQEKDAAEDNSRDAHGHVDDPAGRGVGCQHAV